MVSVSRSVGVLPYQGGTFGGSAQVAMCRLSATRRVWVSCQNAPAWMIGTVVDTPGGWIASTGTPVVTNQQLLVQRVVGTSTYAVKLNSNTFAVMVHTTYTANYSYSVFEVDTQGIMSQVDSGNMTLGSIPITSGQGYNNVKYVELQDNSIMLFGFGLANTTTLQSLKAVYNPSTKKLTWDSAITTHFSIATTYNGEIVARQVPGRTHQLITVRLIPSAVANWSWLSGTQSIVVDNTGARLFNNTQLPGAIGATTNTSTGDLFALPGDRLAICNGPYSVTFYSFDYTSGTTTNLGSGNFSAVAAYDLLGRFYLPLTKDYFLTGNRLPFHNPISANPMRFKVVRRVDQNLFEQSPSSALNSNAGFGTTTLPTTIQAPNAYPELVEGKLFYWGVDVTTGLKLSWTVIGLNTPD